jgi:hypothetical protein
VVSYKASPKTRRLGALHYKMLPQEEADASISTNPETEQKLQLSKHVGYLFANLQRLPEPYAGQESNRLTLAYFTVVGLKILDALDEASFMEVIPSPATFDDRGQYVMVSRLSHFCICADTFQVSLSSADTCLQFAPPAKNNVDEMLYFFFARVSHLNVIGSRSDNCAFSWPPVSCQPDVLQLPST